MSTTDTRASLARRGREREALLLKELERIVRELREMGAQRIILFGSRARGEGGVWSDADLMVVMPSTEAFVERIVNIYRRLRPQAEMDILVYTPVIEPAVIFRSYRNKTVSKSFKLKIFFKPKSIVMVTGNIINRAFPVVVGKYVEDDQLAL